ncbi:MAG: polysaccharide deacetylase family protein [Chloroflexi bacterium]|nr:polysaccharide deacetylase family protein [Chloroflexota bacterium]
MQTKSKPCASLSLDLDNLWSYMKTHGDAGWESFPSYLDVVVPRVLKFLKERNLQITFFVVGQDAALEKNHAALKSLAEAGHEIGNHSFNHEPWLQKYSAEQVETEIAQAEEIIEKVTGEKPIGFRGPGFSVSDTVIAILKRRGYLYDASTLPTYIGPLARLYYFMTAKLKAEEMSKRDNLFGSVRDGFRPVRTHFWRTEDGKKQELIEIPVTTMPVFKIPIHVSYIIYIATYSPALALFYFRVALWLCRLTGTHPSLLLHPLDFLGCDDIKELAFFPAMNLSKDKKLKLVDEVLRMYASYFNILPMQKYANTIKAFL